MNRLLAGLGATVVVVLAVTGVVLSGPVGSYATAFAAGEVRPNSIYKVATQDGGSTFMLVLADGGAKFVDHSGCAKKLPSTLLLLCSRVCQKDPFTGVTPFGPCDPGDGNVMQAGQWTGIGCTETACAVMAGDPEP